MTAARSCGVRIAIGVALALGGAAHADVLELPPGSDPVPLIVILHGDREHAKPAAARWHAGVAKRGWALLAIDCPQALGCKDSWWRWDGDPKYVLDRIAAVKKQRAITRVALVGWSGGASYIGWRAQAWTGIDRIVIHGGGMAPSSDACVAGPPIYFLVGDKNPLHHLAIALRDYFTGCKREVTFDLVRGGDHVGEAAALTPARTKVILDWMVAH
jgi:hypothetical protein